MLCRSGPAVIGRQDSVGHKATAYQILPMSELLGTLANNILSSVYRHILRDTPLMLAM